MFYKTNPIL